jgi:hypothetical protein
MPYVHEPLFFCAQSRRGAKFLYRCDNPCHSLCGLLFFHISLRLISLRLCAMQLKTLRKLLALTFPLRALRLRVMLFSRYQIDQTLPVCMTGHVTTALRSVNSAFLFFLLRSL